MIQLTQEFLRQARDQVVAARAGEWDRVRHIVDFRQVLVDRLNLALGEAKDIGERMQLAEVISEILEIDAEIMLRGQRETERLVEELRRAQQARSLVSSYNWARDGDDPGRTKVVDRRG